MKRPSVASATPIKPVPGLPPPKKRRSLPSPAVICLMPVPSLATDQTLPFPWAYIVAPSVDQPTTPAQLPKRSAAWSVPDAGILHNETRPARLARSKSRRHPETTSDVTLFRFPFIVPGPLHRSLISLLLRKWRLMQKING